MPATPTLPLVVYNRAKSLNARRVIVVFQPTPGVCQVISTVAVGTITTAGNVTATLTAAGLAGSPIALSVAVLLGDTAAMWAQKVRLALAANATITAVFSIDPALDASITLRRINPAANDVTLNLALANGTSVGVTAAPTATQVTAGSAAGVPVNYIGKLAEIKGDTTVSDSKFPGQDGVSRPVDHTATEAVESITLKDMEDVETVIASMSGKITGITKGTAQAFFVTPADPVGTCRAVSDVFACARQRGGNISTEGFAKNPTLEFLAEEADGMTLRFNQTVIVGT